MPYYNYECDVCSMIQEEYHLMKDSPKIKCEKCGKVMTKVISAPQISMNNHEGTGLHEVDNI